MRAFQLLRKLGLVLVTVLLAETGQSLYAQVGQSVAPAGQQAEPLAGPARMANDPTMGALAGGAGGNMTYHFGPVQHTQKIFTIFWNPTVTPFPSGYQATIDQFVQDLNGTPYYAIASQYGDGAGNIRPTLSYGGTWLDTTNAYPSNNLVSYSDMLAEVNRAKTANGWTSDANSYFQVYTASGIGSSAGSGLCGLHYFANPAIGQILFPQPGCYMSSPWPNNQTVDAAINTSAHEIMETVTDPQGNAWYFTNASGEIGDLCNFSFGARKGDGSNVSLHGHPYIIQLEWSNATSSCVVSVGPPFLQLNADGRSDAFVYRASVGDWYRENTAGGGGFSETGGGWAPGWSVQSANFNGDALTDMFVFSTTTGAWYKLLNDGTGFTTQASGYWWPGWQRYVLDLDGDGIDDLFLYDPVSGQWYECISTPTGFTYYAGQWSSGWEVYPMALNSDLMGDLFLFNRTTGQWFWVLGAAGGGFTYPMNSVWAADWKLYPGDFNGDGLTDLLLLRPTTGENYVALTTGAGFTYVSGAWIPGWTPSVTDLDGNGKADLFLYNKTNGNWVELLSNGAGAFSQVGTGYWSAGWDLYPADFNGDSRGDWLLYNPTNGQYWQAWNLSNGTFTYYGGNWVPGLTIVTGPPIR